MSEPPEKKQPWGKYFAEQGGARPPAGPASAQPASKPAAQTPKAGSAASAFSGRKAGAAPAPKGPIPFTPPAPARESAVSDELAAALKKLAEEYAAPAVTSAPFVTAMQRAAVAREEKRERRKRYAKLAGVLAVALVALHFTVTLVVYRAPTPEALEAHIQDLPGDVVAFYSSTRQPLQTDSVTYEETDQIDSQHIRYAAAVTLTLRKPLYIPAVTNGTAAYRQLQESLQLARQRDLKFNIFPPGQGPPPPELPLLLQVSHREGETLVIRLPFEAKRSGWQWRLQPPLTALRSANHPFVGDSLDHFQSAPYFIFGEASAMAEVRQLMKQARDYIIAVAKEVQKRSGMQAVDETPKPIVGPDAAAVPADGKSVGPDTPAKKEGGRPLFDPNAPAVEPKAPARAAKKPIFDPYAPAVEAKAPAFDPNAPAIVVPSVVPAKK